MSVFCLKSMFFSNFAFFFYINITKLTQQKNKKLVSVHLSEVSKDRTQIYKKVIFRETKWRITSVTVCHKNIIIQSNYFIFLLLIKVIQIHTLTDRRFDKNQQICSFINDPGQHKGDDSKCVVNEKNVDILKQKNVLLVRTLLFHVSILNICLFTRAKARRAMLEANFSSTLTLMLTLLLRRRVQ